MTFDHAPPGWSYPSLGTMYAWSHCIFKTLPRDPFHRWGNWGRELSGLLPKDHRLVNRGLGEETGSGAPCDWLQSPLCCSLQTCSPQWLTLDQPAIQRRGHSQMGSHWIDFLGNWQPKPREIKSMPSCPRRFGSVNRASACVLKGLRFHSGHRLSPQ